MSRVGSGFKGRRETSEKHMERPAAAYRRFPKSHKNRAFPRFIAKLSAVA